MFHVEHLKYKELKGDNVLEINVFQVDAFSDKAFGGNPAGVVPDARSLTQEQMQNIAKEMNISETAFVIPLTENLFQVRFFTPICEVDLCGHATIATFFTLAERGYIKSLCNGRKVIFQQTRAGKLAVELEFKDGIVDKVFMEQVTPKDLGKINNIDKLLQAMGIDMEDIGIGNSTISPELISTGLPDIILPIKKKEILDNLKIDMRLLSEVSKELEVMGVHAFYLPKLNSDIVYTRNFAPLVGIDEEAATGTSNGALIYFLKKNKLIEDDKILSYQGETMNRPSKIYCSISEKDIVKVGGRAKIMIDGIISI